MPHTQGPWTISAHNDGGFSILAYDEQCHIADVPNEDGQCNENDATLIATAPELLETLYCILNIESAALAGGKLNEFKEMDVAYHFEMVRAAITKAEGRFLE